MNLNINISVPVGVEKPNEVNIKIFEYKLGKNDVQQYNRIDTFINYIRNFKKLVNNTYFILPVNRKSLKIDSFSRLFFSPISYSICKFLKRTALKKT
ncbi:MAG TPA: hypothetical protein VFD91_04040, partial [Mariniphaga sp.]|nr:hypothetical protein [Mariniphaga sp.]